MKFLDYFFYKDYMFNKLLKHESPFLVSVIIITIFEFSAILLTLEIVNIYVNEINLTYEHIGFILFIGIWILIFIVNYIYYLKNEKIIIEKFKNESSIMRILGFIIYFVISLSTIFLSLYFGSISSIIKL